MSNTDINRHSTIFIRSIYLSFCTRRWRSFFRSLSFPLTPADASEDFTINGNKVHLTMLHNPSHLEAVNPVSMGKTRSKQQTLRDGAFSSDSQKQFGSNVINVQVYSLDFMHIHLVSQRINSFFGFSPLLAYVVATVLLPP